MKYSTIIPDSSLQHIVECFWFVEGDDTEQQKIIPDGFPEIIFHFGDAYEFIAEQGIVTLQDKILISGQISRPIMLRATGRSDVFGIKFKPSGAWNFLRLDMRSLKDRIIPLRDINHSFAELEDILFPLANTDRVKVVSNFILTSLGAQAEAEDISPILKTIENENGNILIEQVCAEHHITPKKLQRLFTQQIGITAKQYSRIVRFRAVYAMLQKPALTKSDSLYLSGYFDQPHFNKEFREFTNENPEKWFSGDNAFANLFMNR